MTRRHVTILGLLLVALLAVWWLDMGTANTLRPMTYAELQQVPDERLAQQVVDDLALRVLAPGADRSRWRKFAEPARHAWALAVVETGCLELDPAGFVSAHAQDDDCPTLADAQAACLAIGLPEAAQAFDEAARGARNPKTIQQRLLRSLGQQESRHRRLAYLREHLERIADPF